jgi:arylsulfatase A-like enzyme
VSIVNLAPTLVDLAGLDIGVPGHSLRAPSTQAVVVSMASAEVFSDARDLVGLPEQDEAALGPFASLAVRSGDWSKVGSLWHPTRWVHRPSDPRELDSGEAPPDTVADRLDAEWQALVSSQDDLVLPPLDAGQQSVLEALGYIEPE